MAWGILFIAGLLEVGWAIGLKYTEGFTRYLWAGAGTGIAMIVSMFLLGYAMRFLPVGTAYAVWTGIGAIGSVLAGMLLFKDEEHQYFLSMKQTEKDYSISLAQISDSLSGFLLREIVVYLIVSLYL